MHCTHDTVTVIADLLIVFWSLLDEDDSAVPTASSPTAPPGQRVCRLIKSYVRKTRFNYFTLCREKSDHQDLVDLKGTLDTRAHPVYLGSLVIRRITLSGFEFADLTINAFFTGMPGKS